MSSFVKRIKRNSARKSRACDVMLLLVMFMTYFIVAKSVHAETRLAAASSVAHMHASGTNEVSKIKINLATEPGSDQDPNDDDGTCDTLVDLDIDHFVLSPFTFEVGHVEKTRHPLLDLALTLPSNGFGLEDPPELV